MFEKIMKMLRDRGESVADLCKGADIPYSTWKNLEYRKSIGSLSVKNLKKIARYFGITLDELCEEVE